LPVNNSVATINKWKSSYVARIISFNKSSKEIVPYQQEFQTLECHVKNDSIGLRKSDKKSDSDTDSWCSYFLGIRLRLHPKTFDSLGLRHQLGNQIWLQTWQPTNGFWRGTISEPWYSKWSTIIWGIHCYFCRTTKFSLFGYPWK